MSIEFAKLLFAIPSEFILEFATLANYANFIHFTLTTHVYITDILVAEFFAGTQ